MIRSLWLLFVKQYSPLHSTVTSLYLLSASPWTSTEKKISKEFEMVQMCSFYMTCLALYISVHIEWFKLVWKLFVERQQFNVDRSLGCW